MQMFQLQTCPDSGEGEVLLKPAYIDAQPSSHIPQPLWKWFILL